VLPDCEPQAESSEVVMTSQNLPDRPNVEHLKKQAKNLLHAARAREPAALRRFHVLPTLANRSLAALQTADLALHGG
jgi:hypothetical protein